MNYYKKKFAALIMFTIISTSLTSCKNDYSNYNNANNVSYTTVSTSAETISETNAAIQITYIVNTNTGKFHYEDCPSVEQMSEHNKREYVGDRNVLISNGYKPCKRCEP